MSPDKRWLTTANLVGDGEFEVGGPRMAPSDVGFLVPAGEVALLGVDFVLGFPAAYVEARKAVDATFARCAGFGDWLRHLAADETEMFDVGKTPNEISLSRPFYPSKPGGTSRTELVEALGFDSPMDLFRACDRAGDGQPVAAPLFWTLGANQVGKATLSGWRDLMLPLLSASGRKQVGLWPFDGQLSELLASHDVVIAETWPRLFFPGLGLSRLRKSNADDRGRMAARLVAWGDARPWLRWAPGTRSVLQDGFADRAGGRDDALDSLIGVLGLLATLMGEPGFGPPDPARASRLPQWEGWILGRKPGSMWTA